MAAQNNHPALNQLKKLDEVAESMRTETRPPSASQEVKNHPVPPEERTTAQQAPAAQAQLDSAANAIAAARTAVALHEESDKRLKSDPRYERDQKVYELGQQGKLGAVPPAPAEKAAMAVRAGLDPNVAEQIPATPEQQVAQDMPRLEKAEEITSTSTSIEPGVSETGEPKNNLDIYKKEGKNTGGRAPAEETFDSVAQNSNEVIK